MATIRIRDFSRSPGGRYVAQGPWSGEEYRNEILVPALRAALEDHDVLTVELDGTSGYGSSFLEEAFGGLIRERRFSAKEVRGNLKIVAHDRLYAPFATLAQRYITDAEKNLIAA